jgi:hypothetical protein
MAATRGEHADLEATMESCCAGRFALFFEDRMLCKRDMAVFRKERPVTDGYSKDSHLSQSHTAYPLLEDWIVTQANKISLINSSHRTLWTGHKSWTGAPTEHVAAREQIAQELRGEVVMTVVASVP